MTESSIEAHDPSRSSGIPIAQPASGVRRVVAIFVAAAILSLCLITLTWSDLGGGFFIVCAGAVVATLVFVWWAARVDRRLAVLAGFTTLYCAFHFGLLAAHMAGQPVYTMLGGVLRWYVQERLVAGAYAASLMLLLGLAMAAVVTLLRGRPATIASSTPARSRVRPLPVTAMLAVAVLAWLVIVPGVLGVTNYTQYNAIVRGDLAGLFSAVLIFLYPGIAALFFWSAMASDRLVLPFAIYAAFGAVAFPIGLRGEVLFPLAMVVPVLMAQGRLTLSAPLIAVGAYAVLLASSFGRIFRADSDLTEAFQGASGLTGLAELGGSLRPVVEVRRWLEGGVDQLRWGETYYAPFERTFQRVFPFFERGSALEDDRLMNVLLVQRTGGNYGFSIAAEALINFGLIGCFLIGAVCGWILITFGDRVSRGALPVLWAATVFGLFIHIRQGFVTAYGSAFMFLVISLALVWLLPAGQRTATRQWVRR